MKLVYVILSVLIGTHVAKSQDIVIPKTASHEWTTSAAIANDNAILSQVLGQVKLPARSELIQSYKIRSSFGIALDWFSAIGPLNFTLAQPITKNDTDITESFRFNLGTTF